MSESTKISYSGLAPHQALFAQGLPVLTYHQVAPRPRGVKWRSLYVSPRLFRRQMAELAAARFSTASLGDPRPVSGNPDRHVVVTFDDGYAATLDHAAPVLVQHGFSAIQFLVAGQIGGTNAWDVADGERPARLMDKSEVRTWLAAGLEIGSHTITHPRLTRLPRAQQREEIGASRRMLEDAFGVPIRHFCYPYGDADEAVIDLAQECGYQTACLHLQSGVNLASTPSWALRRIEARYPKRNLRSLLQALRGWWR